MWRDEVSSHLLVLGGNEHARDADELEHVPRHALHIQRNVLNDQMLAASAGTGTASKRRRVRPHIKRGALPAPLVPLKVSALPTPPGWVLTNW